MAHSQNNNSSHQPTKLLIGENSGFVYRKIILDKD